MKPDVARFKNLAAASLAAADFIVEVAAERIGEKAFFSLVLSGGRTPRLLYTLLGGPPRASRIDWPRVHLFWGDERHVPPDDPGSNYRMALETLISGIPIPEANVHRVPVERPSADEAARAYEEELRGFFGSSGGFPALDLILLGVGDDGHAASLFPGDAALTERRRWVTSVTAPADFGARQRVTLTLPVIDRAGVVLFLVALPGKERVVNAILQGSAHAAAYPAAMVRGTRVRWFLAEEH